MGYAERRNRYGRRAWLFYWKTAPIWERILCWIAWIVKRDWNHLLILKKEGLR